MKTQTITYVSSFDEQKLTGYHYATQKPKALVAIFHGMAEHQKRYIWLAEQLVKADFDVLTIDQRGHGESLYDGKVKGYFADQDGWARNLADLHAMVEIVRTETGLPLIVFGHSMGSLVARSYLKHYPEHIRTLFLSASPDRTSIAVIGKYLINLIVLFKGKQHTSAFMTGMSFGNYNKKILNPKTPFDWLSIDEQNVKAYIDDELCGFDFTAQAYVDLLDGMEECYTETGWKVLNPDLPIRFVSGEGDPGYLPGGLEHAVKCLVDAGYKNVTFEYVKGVRHEIFNEIKKTETVNDLIDWLDNSIEVTKR